MNSMKTLLAAAVAASALSAPAAFSEVEVAASAAVANMYLWRGTDLGDGSAAVSGDVTVSAAGFYTGVWASSGDSALGQEYDLYAGYAMEAGGFSFDLSVWNYIYSDESLNNGGNDKFADLSEILFTVGYGPVSVTYYDNIAGNSEYSYLTVGAEYKQFSATVGMASQGDNTDGVIDDDGLALVKTGTDYTHLDLSYAYNDNFSLTLSQIIDDDAEDTNKELDNDLLVVVSYSLAF